MKEYTPYSFLVVNTNIDFLVIKNKFCKKCLQKKMDVNILSTYLITKEEASEITSYSIRALRVICECIHTKDIPS